MVEIQLKQGRRYQIGTDEPAKLQAAIQSALADLNEWAGEEIIRFQPYDLGISEQP